MTNNTTAKWRHFMNEISRDKDERKKEQFKRLLSFYCIPGKINKLKIKN